MFSDDLRADSASTRVRSLVRVLCEDTKLVIDLNAKRLLKRVRECNGYAKCIFHKRFTVECCTRPARINGQLLWCIGGSVRVVASMYL